MGNICTAVKDNIAIQQRDKSHQNIKTIFNVLVKNFDYIRE